MSRRREEKRTKEKELARQLGDADVDADTLKDRARVSRPVLRTLSVKRGVLNKLFSRKEHLVLALFLVDSKGAHKLACVVLDEGEHHVDKVTYHRPAHFVLVAWMAEDASGIDSFAVDQLSAEDEKPRAVSVGEKRGVAFSIRGVGRVEARHSIELESGSAVIEVEV
jgi:hypothetical protein